MNKFTTIAATVALALLASVPGKAQAQIFGGGFGMPQIGAPMPGGFGGNGQLPGAGLLPQDGQIVATIASQCSGEPTCMAAAWGRVEIQRCRNGMFVPGGCFGPNGEIMKVLNQVLPHNFQPQVIIGNAQSDLQNGPGASNDLVGKDGWVCQTLFGGC